MDVNEIKHFHNCRASCNEYGNGNDCMLMVMSY